MTATVVESLTATGERVRMADPLHTEIHEWLDDESTLLDEGRTLEWVTQLVAPDVLYRLPVRQNRLRDDPKGQFSEGMYHYDENYTTLAMKVTRLVTTASPWAENPVSRTRRFVTNIRVHRTDNEGEFEVISSLLITRSRYTEDVPLILSGQRKDVLRRTDSGFQLARRYFYVDQATLGFPNLAIFF